MTINPDAGRIRENLGGMGFEEARTLRRAELETRVEEATVTPVQRLSPGEISEHNGFYNGIVSDLDRIRQGRVGSIGDRLDCFRPFETPAEHDIRDATRPRIGDNEKAGEIRNEYRRAMQEARRERAQADKMARKLGEGHHRLSNGDEVDVTKDPATGHVTVRTRRPDGSTKTVQYDPQDRDQVSVRRRSADGREERLEQNGTTITRAERDGEGRRIRTTWDVDEEGRPVREKKGPGTDDFEKTTVGEDGSTDTRRLIYNDEQGTPVYEDSHEPSSFPEPFPSWNPWRPWPGPYSWEPLLLRSQQE